MKRSVTVLTAVLVIVGTIGVFPMAGLAQETTTATTTVTPTPTSTTTAQTEASDNSSGVTAGHRLSGVVGVVEAELSGEIDGRAFGIAVARAASNDSKAKVVGETLTQTDQRLEELRSDREALEAAKANGTISNGTYQARMAVLATNIENVKRMTNASAAEADRLPRDVLERNGVNVSAIQRLRQDAQNMTGPEVAAVARSIAGSSSGVPLARGPPAGMPGSSQAGPAGQAGPPGTSGGPGQAQGDENGTDSADRAIDRAEQNVEAAGERIEQAREHLGDNASDEARTALADAETALERAKTALADARSALEDGDVDRAMTLAEEANDHANTAESHVSDSLAATDTQQDGSGEETESETDTDESPGQGGNDTRSEGSNGNQ